MFLSSALVAWALLWGLAELIDQQPLPEHKAPQRTEISLLEAEPEATTAPDLTASQRAQPQRPQSPRTQQPKKAPQPKVQPKKQPKEPKPPPKKKPPKPQPPKERFKMVEQDPEETTPPPEQSDYLSNVDRKVEKQTRAKNARLDSQRPAKKKTAPREKTPQKESKKQKERKAQAARAEQSPLLKMRGSEKPQPAATQVKDALATRNHGHLSQKSKAASATAQGEQQATSNPRPRMGLAGSLAAMQAAISPQVASEGRKAIEKPQKAGIWDEARKRYASPLDNVVPEVQAGNQTALNSRKHPFAQYIAAMHREIHAEWGEGVLRRWDSLPSTHAWNDFSLWTRVEIVLWPSGEIDSVKTIRRSGNSSFDGVARNSVYNAGPYPNAPEQILSGNGKVYIHWAFHRNAYACGTFGAEPFILDNAGRGVRPDPDAPIDEGAVPAETRRRVYGPAAAPTR